MGTVLVADFYDIKKQIMDRSRAIRLLHGLSDIGESATNYSLCFSLSITTSYSRRSLLIIREKKI